MYEPRPVTDFTASRYVAPETTLNESVSQAVAVVPVASVSATREPDTVWTLVIAHASKLAFDGPQTTAVTLPLLLATKPLALVEESVPSAPTSVSASAKPRPGATGLSSSEQ